MKSDQIDIQLKALQLQQSTNWQHIIFKLRKHLDVWTHQNIKPFWGNMKLSYMPVICNISIEGSTAAEISKKSMVAKQSMSRTIKELEANGMIVTKNNIADRRSEHLELTDTGKQMVLDAHMDQLKMVEIYEQLVGKEKLEAAVDVLNKIIKYHENVATK